MLEVVCIRWTSWGFGQTWSPSTLSWCDQGALFNCNEQENANSQHFGQFKRNNQSFLVGIISRLLCCNWKMHIPPGRLWASWSVELCGGYSAGHEGWQPSPRQAPTRSWGSRGGIQFNCGNDFEKATKNTTCSSWVELEQPTHQLAGEVGLRWLGPKLNLWRLCNLFLDEPIRLPPLQKGASGAKLTVRCAN